MATSDFSGLRIVVTRAHHQAGSLARMLRERGAVVEEIPTIEIKLPATFEPLDQALDHVASYDWLILTSANGVEALWNRAEQIGTDLSPLGKLRICAIGPATQRAIQSRGLQVAVVINRSEERRVGKECRSRWSP